VQIGFGWGITTVSNYSSNEDAIASRMFSLWPQIDRGSLNSSPFREKYQDNGAIDLGPRFANLGRMDNVTLSTRLTVAMNTFWMLSREAQVSGQCEK
jgi:hypothetical protein